MSLTKLQESKLRALPGFDDVHARLRCDEPLSYKEAQKIVQKAGIQNAREFYARKPKPEGVPSQPYVIYKGKGWKNWPEFFGTEWLSYAEARRIVQKAGIKTWKEFRAWKHPVGVPSNPDTTYKGKGWKSYPEFLGTVV